VCIAQQLFTFSSASANTTLEAHGLVHRVADIAIGIDATILFLTFDFFWLTEMRFVFGYDAALAAFIKFGHHYSPLWTEEESLFGCRLF
jgi:hypothetical protein